MSKVQKLLSEFLKVPPPKDFRFDDLTKLLASFDFTLDQSGGGSHCNFSFRPDPNIVIYAFRPHPEPVLPVYLLKQIKAQLKQMGLIE